MRRSWRPGITRSRASAPIFFVVVDDPNILAGE
jgi:hypothetical protein